jgi:tetratricopeptide (TPR) repeat protein
MKRRFAWLMLVVGAASLQAAEPGPPDPRIGWMQFERAWFLEEGRSVPQQAIPLYQRLVSRYAAGEPLLAARALLHLVACYEKIGETDKAIEAYSEARTTFAKEISRLPEYQQYTRTLARITEKFEKPAEEQIKIAYLRSLPRHMVLELERAKRGEARRYLHNQPDRAIKAWEDSIIINLAVNRRHLAAEAQLRIADTLLEIGRDEEALDQYDQIAARFPRQSQAVARSILHTGHAHRSMGALEEAVFSYHRLLRSAPNQTSLVAWARLWMGDAYRALGEMKAAQQAWKLVLDMGQDRNQARALRPQLLSAALLLGPGPGPKKLRTRVPLFENDLWYFLAVRMEIEGRPQEALNYYKMCQRITQRSGSGREWPFVLAERAALTFEGEKAP